MTANHDGQIVLEIYNAYKRFFLFRFPAKLGNLSKVK